MVDVFHRPFPQSAISRPIKAMIDIVTRFFQQLHSRVNRPSSLPPLCGGACATVLAIVHCAILMSLIALSIAQSHVPVPDPRWTPVCCRYQRADRRSESACRYAGSWAWPLLPCQSQERKQRKGCRGRSFKIRIGVLPSFGEIGVSMAKHTTASVACIGPVCPFFPFFLPSFPKALGAASRIGRPERAFSFRT